MTAAMAHKFPTRAQSQPPCRGEVGCGEPPPHRSNFGHVMDYFGHKSCSSPCRPKCTQHCRSECGQGTAVTPPLLLRGGRHQLPSPEEERNESLFQAVHVCAEICSRHNAFSQARGLRLRIHSKIHGTTRKYMAR